MEHQKIPNRGEFLGGIVRIVLANVAGDDHKLDQKSGGLTLRQIKIQHRKQLPHSSYHFSETASAYALDTVTQPISSVPRVGGRHIK